jgi:hypothetical protein
VTIDPSAVQAALEKLQKDSEPEARFMRTPSGQHPAYNVQTAVDAEHSLIVAQTENFFRRERRKPHPHMLRD